MELRSLGEFRSLSAEWPEARAGQPCPARYRRQATHMHELGYEVKELKEEDVETMETAAAQEGVCGVLWSKDSSDRGPTQQPYTHDQVRLTDGHAEEVR